MDDISTTPQPARREHQRRIPFPPTPSTNRCRSYLHPVAIAPKSRTCRGRIEFGLAMKLLADSAEGVGYLLKDRVSDIPEFLGAVRRVAAGGSAIDPTIVSTLVSRRRNDDPLAPLTRREREVLELMAAGNSNQGIADQLVITVRAVEKYVSSIFDKLALPATGSESRRVLAVLLFLRT